MNIITDKPKIGIVSGVGPLAGSDVLSKVFAYAADAYGAHEDSEYPDVILLNHGIAGVDNTASLNSAFKEEIIEMVEQLESWGAGIIGIACNTAHAYFDDIKLKPTTKLVNLIDVVAETAEANPGTYGLLTSRGTKEQQLYVPYLKKHGVEFIQTTEEQQEQLDQAIDKVMEHKAEAGGKNLAKVLAQMNEKNVHKFIAGCTELPIALTGVDTHDEVLDSNFILAKALVDTYFAKS